MGSKVQSGHAGDSTHVPQFHYSVSITRSDCITLHKQRGSIRLARRARRARTVERFLFLLPRLPIPFICAPIPPFPSSATLVAIKVMLYRTIRNNDFLAQHSITTLLRRYSEQLQHCSNIATQCCAKNRLCESSRVTSPLDVYDVVSMLFSFVFNYTYVSNKETKCKPQIKIEPQYIQPRCSILLLGHFRVPKLLTFKTRLSPKPIRLFAREQKIIFHINSLALSVALKRGSE